jgi:nucleoside-diphosphate-sugar epimerase
LSDALPNTGSGSDIVLGAEYPSVISNEAQLTEVMSRPSARDVALMRELEGDLLLLGVGGKMGPTLALRARRAIEAAGVSKRVIGVARFSSGGVKQELEQAGVETISADLLEEGAVEALPQIENVIYMVARKFGSHGDEPLTWAMNTWLPAQLATRYQSSRVVAFSSGNVYPLMPLHGGGATEETAPNPVGEYAQSVLGRERLLSYLSGRLGTPMTLLRLNYAIDLRYGVLLDIGTRVFERRPVDVSMGFVNVIWQGDANSVALRCLRHCQSPPLVLNLTGPETLTVRWIAHRFAKLFGVEAEFRGVEADSALLSNASACHRLFGYPTISAGQMIEWTAHWIAHGGHTWNKPTRFEVRDGKF